MIEQYCENCRFFVVNKYTQGEGDCRKRPPILVVNENRILTRFPTVYTFHWCGEWQERHGIQAAKENCP